MSYYLRCGRCGRVVSSAILGGTERVTLRAIVECPECIAAEPDVEQQIAAAVAAEREACALVADRFADSFLEAATLLSLWAARNAELQGATAGTIAAAIRARAGEGEQVPMSDNGTCAT